VTGTGSVQGWMSREKCGLAGLKSNPAASFGAMVPLKI